MLFTEPAFLFFFLPAVLLLYAVTPVRLKNLLLVLASLLFYAWGEWRFLPWLLASMAADYVVTLALAARKAKRGERLLLALGITLDLGLLVAFKYAAFFTEGANHLLGMIGRPALHVPELPLPLAISFFTFHKISYKVDVYRGKAEVRRNPIDLMLYILLFPQLIAGPIVRYRNIAAALIKRTVTRAGFVEGIRRFCIGLGKKMLLANSLGAVADEVFAIPLDVLPTGVAWLGILCFALQIYFDFSGYSDMAIGMARMLGFPFPENFNFPYVATSVTDFWRRWHISLTSWFRDYLYVPLTGNRVWTPAWRVYLSVFAVFFLCGLWHGAKTTFVVWGIVHGTALIIERLFLLRVLDRCPRVLRHLYCLAFILVSWSLFRAEDLTQAGGLLEVMFFGGSASSVHNVARYLHGQVALALLAGLIGSMPWLPKLLEYLDRRRERRAGGASVTALDLAFGSIGRLTLVGILVLSFAQIAAGTYNPFIYFRF